MGNFLPEREEEGGEDEGEFELWPEVEEGDEGGVASARIRYFRNVIRWVSQDSGSGTAAQGDEADRHHVPLVVQDAYVRMMVLFLRPEEIDDLLFQDVDEDNEEDKEEDKAEPKVKVKTIEVQFKTVSKGTITLALPDNTEIAVAKMMIQEQEGIPYDEKLFGPGTERHAAAARIQTLVDELDV